jgi:hypothetical protein
LLTSCQAKQEPAKAPPAKAPTQETDTNEAKAQPEVAVAAAQPDVNEAAKGEDEQPVVPQDVAEAPPVLDTSCAAITDAVIEPVSEFLVGIGLEKEPARAALLAANQDSFVKACEALSETERGCLSSARPVMAALGSCGVEGKLSWTWPEDLVTRFEHTKLSPEEQAQRLPQMLGVWVNAQQPGWEQTWTITETGATLEHKQGDNPPRLTEYLGFEFHDEATLGVRSSGSTQYVPFLQAEDRFYLYFNTANYHYPVPDENAFAIDMFQRYLSYAPESCKVLDCKTAIVYDADCKWEDKDGGHYFSYQYQSLAGWPSGNVSDAWLKVGDRLLDPWLARSVFVKQAPEATP